MVKSPHDALFKSTFRELDNARGALRAAMPRQIGDALDWATLAHEPGSFVDPLFAERHTDLLFSTSWRDGGTALVYTLFEHQSSVDDWMAFRLLRYLVRIWEAWRNDHPAATSLPTIVPIVLYHGDKPWSVPLSFGALFDLPDHVRAPLAAHLVQFSYLLDDLSEISDADLRARVMTASAKLVTLCFKHARASPDMLDLLRQWGGLMREVEAAPNGMAALARAMRYILLVSDHVELEQVRDLIASEVSIQAKESIVTAGERLIQQGIQQGLEQGIQQGLEQGIQQGLEQGKHETLLALLQRRFRDQMTAEGERRLAAASTAQLERWTDRLFSVSTLRDLLAE